MPPPEDNSTMPYMTTGAKYDALFFMLTSAVYLLGATVTKENN